MQFQFGDIIRVIGPIGFIVVFMLALYLFGRDIQKLKRKHKEELKNVRESLPFVQHCNRRTNYEFINHRYDPETCKHCAEIQDVLNER